MEESTNIVLKDRIERGKETLKGTISQAKYAKLFGVTQVAIFFWENGKRPVNNQQKLLMAASTELLKLLHKKAKRKVEL